MNIRIIKCSWSSISIKWLFKKAKGRTSGILLMWDDMKYNVVNCIEGSFSISTNIIEPDGFSWWIITVYGSVNRKEKKKRQF